MYAIRIVDDMQALRHPARMGLPWKELRLVFFLVGNQTVLKCPQ